MSESVLEQHEIDQLVRAIRDGSLPSAPPPGPDGPVEDGLVHLLDVEPLDFTDPSWGKDRILRRRLRVLDMVFDRLAPALQISLTKTLRFPVRAETESIELRKFGDLREQYQNSPCLYQVMRLDPLQGSSMLVFESTVIYALIDAMMGGLGVGELPGERDVSDIEMSLIVNSTQELLRDFEHAWRPWFPLKVEWGRSERNANATSLLDEQEVCHIATIVVSGDVLPRSPLRFVLPYTSLEPLFEATSSRVGEEMDANWRANLEENLLAALGEVSVVLGEARASAERASALSPGDVIELERRVTEDVDIQIEGQSVFAGRIGKSHHQYAVRIGERRQVKRDFIDRTNGQILVRKGLISREQLAVARVDEMVNRRPLLESVVKRGWVDRTVLQTALGSGA